MRKIKLTYRVILAVLMLPVPAAVIFPTAVIVLDPFRQRVFLSGLAVLIAGVVVSVVCIRDFYRYGGGTPAPWDAPEKLVVKGLYRYCRNPMYIGILLFITGLALFFTSPLLLVYNAVIAAAFHLMVTIYEEPRLAVKFGRQWVIYTAMTNRWFPKIR